MYRFTPLIALLFPLSHLQADMEITISKEGPITTLLQARDAIRAKRQAGEKGSAVINVEGGRYEQAETLILEAQDSDLTLRAGKKGKPKFIGGTPVTGFTPHQGEIVKADVAAIMKKGTKYRQVLFDGKRMILARYPNFDATDPLYGGWAFVDAIPKDKIESHSWKRELYIKPQDVRKWEHPEDGEIDIFAGYGWWNFIMPVQDFEDATSKLTLAKPCGYDLHPHNRFHFQNALEELDAPGEWFIDTRTTTLYLWPAEPVEKHEVRVVTLNSFIKINAGAKNISIERLSFTGCNDSAITLTNTEHCTVAGCTLSTVGDFNGTGISISGGTDNVALSNDISHTGSNGISLSGGDRSTLTAARNDAINNHIHHIGIYNKNACGVSCSGVGNTIAHNLIHDGPRMGVQMSGNNIIVEYNHLHHLVMETQDGGAIYTGGRDWISSRGSVWRYNRIHDIVGCGQEADGLKHPWFTFGLYPDDNTGGVDIIGNLVYRIAHTPIHMHNSRDCVVENNVFALGGKFQFDLHGWTKDQNFWKDHFPTMIKGYESVIDQPAWKGMRGMELHPKDAFRDDGTMMSGDIVRRNIMYSNAPGVKYGDLRNCSPKWNTIDENIAWNGDYPVVTGINKVGPDLGEPVFQENFDAAESNKTPKGWGFNHRPRNDVQLIAVDGALRVDCALSQDPKNPKTVFHGPDIPLKPGAAYRVRLRVRSTEPTSPISLALASFKSGAGYWQSTSANAIATPEWQEVETTGRMPREGEAGWKDWMSAFWLRVDCQSDKGQVFIDDVRISEAEPLDAWAAWQDAGWDKKGIIADPMFIDVTNDDFRLSPDSPAITKLGFKPLPIDQMGLIEDKWRKL
ncbi:hypothetical protein BH11VER1_BH11VER1_19370 [soil metagenome]